MRRWGCALLVAGCSQNPATLPAEAEFAPVSFPLPTQAWDCERTGYVVSSRAADQASLWLFLPGETTQLETTDARDDFKSAATRFRMADSSADLILNGQTEACRENRRASLREDAKLRGVSFRATGNEPPWQLELGLATALLSTGYERDLSWYELPPPEENPAERMTRYEMDNGRSELELTLSGQPCTDSMSGEAFPTTVQLRIDGRTLRGCGEPLH